MLDNNSVFDNFIKDIKNQKQYSLLTNKDIILAFSTSLQFFLDNFMKNDSVYSVIYHFNHLMIKKITKKNNQIIEEDFLLSKLSKKSVKRLLKIFNYFLININNRKSFKYYKSLIGDIIYGKIISYIDNNAIISFYDNNGNEIYGYCPFRNLLITERNVLYSNKEPIVFYIKNVIISNNSLKIILSRNSIKIPELLVHQFLQDNNYKLSDYYFKCVRRIAGKRSLIVSVNPLPKDLSLFLKESLPGESIRIFSVKKNSIDGRNFIDKKISYQDIAEKYINLKTIKMKQKNKKNNNKREYLSNSFIDRLNNI